MNRIPLSWAAARLLTMLCFVTPAGCRAQAVKPAAPPSVSTSPAPPLWTDAERAASVAFWSRAGRMSVSFAAARATLTPEASLWFHDYNRTLRTAAPADAALWKAWVDAKFAHDRWEAAQIAGAVAAGAEPDAPGVIPASLLGAAGDPPPLAAALVPKRYRINLDDGSPLTYTAPIAVSPRYPSYRFAEGVISGGETLRGMPAGELEGLMRAAGLTPFEGHVIASVSRLEGGFDAVNTYDTGYVSVGFIQFITAAGGNGSLATVLATEKANQPADFGHDFHSRGIDVTSDGLYAVIDPATGAELRGADAVQKTIHDPRLVAVFQSAGRRSTPFRVAQILTAKRGYYPANDPILVTPPGAVPLTGRVGDVLRSEAGMATAFDRKVNTGHAAPEIAAAVQAVLAAHRLKTLAEVAPYEREVIAAVKYRADFLADPSLTQPPTPPSVSGVPAPKLP